MAKIIMIDGIAGAGKTSTSRALKELIEMNGEKCVLISDPEILAPIIKLKNVKKGNKYIDSDKHITKLILTALKKKIDFVVLDRSPMTYMSLKIRDGMKDTWQNYPRLARLSKYNRTFFVFLKIPRKMLTKTFNRKIKDKNNPERHLALAHFKRTASDEKGKLDLQKLCRIYALRQKQYYEPVFDMYTGKKFKILLDENSSPKKRAKKIFDFCSIS